MGEEVWDFAFALDKDVDEILSEILVTIVVKRSSQTLVADTGGATDAVHVLGDTTIHLAWEVVVDDVLDVLDIPTTSRDAGSDEDGCTTSAESAARQGQYELSCSSRRQ